MCNNVTLEGYIAEGYIAIVLVMFYARYLDNTPTFFNKTLRNPDGLKGAGIRVILNRMTLI